MEKSLDDRTVEGVGVFSAGGVSVREVKGAKRRAKWA